MATPTLTPYSDYESEEEVEVYEAGSDDVRNLITQPQEWQIACTGSTPAPSPIKVEPRPYRNWKPKSPRKTIHDRMSPKSNFRQKRSEQDGDELPQRLYFDNFNNNGNMNYPNDHLDD